MARAIYYAPTRSAERFTPCDPSGPMIHGYHVIMPVYGFWLPNDPRGSWSDFVGKWDLVRFGHATKRLGHRKLAELTDAEKRQRDGARSALDYPPVRLTDGQACAIGRGFADACERNGYTIWACSILPEHTHLVIARHTYKVEQIVNLLKGATTRRVIEEGCHPLAAYAAPGERPPRMWAQHQWKVYLDDEETIEQAIAYVEVNPLEEGKPAQQWPFVTRFSGLAPGWVTYH